MAKIPWQAISAISNMASAPPTMGISRSPWRCRKSRRNCATPSPIPASSIACVPSVEPVSPVYAMGNLASVWRTLLKEGQPQVLNFFMIGDAAIRTNPLYGRGCSAGMIHAHALSAILDATDDPAERAELRIRREPGLGEWSVGVVMIYGFGRHERGLAGDLALVRLARALGVESDRELLARYGPWQGLASIWLMHHPGAARHSSWRGGEAVTAPV